MMCHFTNISALFTVSKALINSYAAKKARCSSDSVYKNIFTNCFMGRFTSQSLYTLWQSVTHTSCCYANTGCSLLALFLTCLPHHSVPTYCLFYILSFLHLGVPVKHTVCLIAFTGVQSHQQDLVSRAATHHRVVYVCAFVSLSCPTSSCRWLWRIARHYQVSALAPSLKRCW